MTPEEINKRVAEYFWPGIMADKDYAKRPTDYYRSNAAMDLLGVLVERGYKPELSYHNLNWWHKFSLPGYKQPEYYAIKPTIPAAICTAIIELIERKGK